MKDMESIYSEDKYGIVRDRYGNFRIGKYNFRYQGRKPRFDMTGITTRKKGIEGITYIQWIEQMLPSDYPFEISKEVYDKILSIINNSVTDVLNTLSLQPIQEKSNKVNSKFFVKNSRLHYICSIKFIYSTDNSESYDDITIGKAPYFNLKYNATSVVWQSSLKDYDCCCYLSDSVYDLIMNKTLQTSELLKSLCASIYKPSPLDVPSL